MANGPLGGNMGTPPVPPQPPQVSFETTAQSRGNFNNFLKSIPPTTALTPLPPMGSTPMMPTPMPPMGGNPMANIDIFNQPMGMMGMNQPPMNPMMQPPMQTPMMMAGGGNVPPRRTDIMGEDHMLAYITPEEGGILKALGGSGAPGPMGIPQFGFGDGDDDGGYGDGDSDTGGMGGGDTDTGGGGGGSDNDGSDNNFSDDAQATDPGGNYGDDGDDDAQDYSDGSGSQDTGNVGDSTSGDYTGGSDGSDNNIDDSDPDSDMDYTDTYTDQDLTDATNIGTGGGDNQDDRPLTNIVNVGAGSNLQYSPQFTADNLEDRGLDPKNFMSPENYAQTTQSQAASQAEMNDAMAIDQAINQAPAANLAANIVSTYNPQQYGLGLDLDDPLGLGFNTAGLIEGARAVQGMRDPEQFTQVASLGNVPGSNIAAITPDAFPTSRPDNLVSLSQGLDVTNPSEMRGLENAVRDNVQVNLTLDDVDINTPAGRDIENKETASLMNAVLSGQVDAPYGIGQPVDVTTGLGEVFNAPVTSAPTGLSPVGTQRAGSRGDIVTPASGIDIFSDPRGMPPQLSSQIAARDGKLTVGDVIPGLRETVRANADEIAARSMPGTAGDMFAPTDQLAPSIARDTVTDRDADALSNIAERNQDIARDL
jgi:hypothetical protein